MNEPQPAASLPTADPTATQPVAYGDGLHARGCPVVHGSGGEVIVVGHEEARRVAEDAETFSSVVSRFLQIPNGLDGEEHRRFRTLLDTYLDASVVQNLSGGFHAVAREVVAEHLTGETVTVDAVGDLGDTFAVRTMLDWLGWAPELEDRLVAWVKENNDATRSGELERTAAAAAEFDAIIDAAVVPKLAAPGEDVTSRLIEDDSLGRRLTREEVVSILRNWTGGDLSSMSYCIGVLLKALADDPPLQERLRVGVSDAEFEAIVDEVLRRDSPFVSNRRVTTCPVTLGGVEVPEGSQVRLHWTAANRDPEAFENPDGFAPEAHAGKNLVWGAGPHYCPGKALSMVELEAFLTELLRAASVRNPEGEDAQLAAVREIHPVGGWSSLPVTLVRLGG
ncbi:cytochrome P450 [Corynebacterium sp.]|uniref:cytochrome P450 n=1 Tax=Corynebacterium sp. TaxID=1720 RepID=UPI0037370AF2